MIRCLMPGEKTVLGLINLIGHIDMLLGPTGSCLHEPTEFRPPSGDGSSKPTETYLGPLCDMKQLVTSCRPCLVPGSRLRAVLL